MVVSHLPLFVISLLALSPFAQSTPAQPRFSKHFSSNYYKGVNLRYVENSGICETTPGVQQVSGYVDIGANSMFFWFFAARESPETAPFTLWLNGGPGCSSMIGLLQENGPCLVNPDGKTTHLNPYSWNAVSNMIYMDQPFGTGFSYGRDDVNSSTSAAPYVWRAFQVLFESKVFQKLQSREFMLATESYGGHYGPEFATYFEKENALIRRGSLVGEIIPLTALLINNGWIDPLIQYKGFIDFAANAPGYGPLANLTAITQMYHDYYVHDGCLDKAKACYAVGKSVDAKSNKICRDADDLCGSIGTSIFDKYDAYDLRQNSSALFPPSYFIDFLQLNATAKAIGANRRFEICSPAVGFRETGDTSRTLLPELGALADSGLRILIWAGDTDIICNWVGGHEAILGMKWDGQQTLAKTPLKNITLNGKVIAAVQNVRNFTFARVYDAGHEVMAFQPEASLEIFKQVIKKEALHSV